ncbi:hypothetical protein CAPTEDRAFT_208340 [Capitella teleta]|uniref:G-protein coupled receptors family 1 profile domain-containing protein n=1 Tax=Capitella teleta TaxID=283909 RepID=R7V1Y3_CAPTE|nr:hypothetical protein CAPTEDRAFT_208340 [Capitella teleta]|eukprot:ELU09686.1 hypothetical protein CAPTEDRAFT_208340 [Capitella teleta]
MATLCIEDCWLNTTEEPQSALLPSRATPFQMVVRTLGIAGGLAAIVINAFTLVAFIHARLDKKSVTNTYIASLNCSDLLCGISGIMVFVSSIIRDAFPEVNQNLFMWMLSGLISFLFYNSLAGTLLISCDRLLATIWPMWYKTKMTSTIARICAMATWLTTLFITNIPLHISATRLDTSKRVLKIVTMNQLQPDKYSEYVLGPIIIILVLANCVVYSFVLIAYKKSIKRLQPSLQTMQLRSRRLTKTILGVVGITLLCWIPTVFFFITPPESDTGFKAQVSRAGFGLLLVPSILDNFIYAFRQNDYRRAYLNLLFGRRRPRDTMPRSKKRKTDRGNANPDVIKRAVQEFLDDACLQDAAKSQGVSKPTLQRYAKNAKDAKNTAESFTLSILTTRKRRMLHKIARIRSALMPIMEFRAINQPLWKGSMANRWRTSGDLFVKFHDSMKQQQVEWENSWVAKHTFIFFPLVGRKDVKERKQKEDDCPDNQTDEEDVEPMEEFNASDEEEMLALALKKCFKYFAGVILSEISEEGTLKVKLMKCVKGKTQQIAFIYPKVDDIDVVDHGDVVTLLPETGPCGGTPRAAKRLYFPEVDLSMYF